VKLAGFFLRKILDSGGVNRVEEDEIGVSVPCRSML